MTDKKLSIFSFVFFLLTLAGMLWTEQQAGCGKVIIRLELEPDITLFKRCVANCNLDWIASNTQLDFLFLIAYSAVLFFVWRGVAGRLKYLAWVTLVPGLFDVIENIHLLKFLYAAEADVTTGSYAIYYWCVRLKFAVLVVVMLTLVGLIGKWFFIKNK